jgi:hypothetical protein
MPYRYSVRRSTEKTPVPSLRPRWEKLEDTELVGVD